MLGAITTTGLHQTKKNNNVKTKNNSNTHEAHKKNMSWTKPKQNYIKNNFDAS